MKSKNFILYFLGFVLSLTTAQVESYDFRNFKRSTKPADAQRYVKPHNRGASKRDNVVNNGRVSPKLDRGKLAVDKNNSFRDRRGLMPHHRNVNDDKPIDKMFQARNTYKGLDISNDPIKYPMNAKKEAWDKNWRYQNSAKTSDQSMMRNFRPKGNNQGLVVTPYRGEFYSRGGKPFAIDPGLLGRWK